jgi:hypothetical protein
MAKHSEHCTTSFERNTSTRSAYEQVFRALEARRAMLSRWVLSAWQLAHMAVQLEIESAPPSHSGTVWSTWYAGGSSMPQSEHRHPPLAATRFFSLSVSVRTVVID